MIVIEGGVMDGGRHRLFLFFFGAIHGNSYHFTYIIIYVLFYMSHCIIIICTYVYM